MLVALGHLSSATGCSDKAAYAAYGLSRTRGPDELSGRISLTLPTTPLSSMTLIPWG